MLSNSHDCGRVKGDIGELAEWRKVICVAAFRADPANWTGNDEVFERVVRKAGLLALWWLVEDIFVRHNCVPSVRDETMEWNEMRWGARL
jgi:hypothetical protein